jgi:cellulose synthase/poly-beta-1,6-N-acetylglucosamine synthase-like glycosyltransferase
MKNIEIPFEKDRGKRYRFFEALPGLVTWTMLLLPFILSFISVTLAAVYIIAYILIYFARTVGVDIRALQGFKMMQQHKALPWKEMLVELEGGEIEDATAKRPQWHYDNVLRLQVQPPVIKPSEIVHVAMIATYNESLEVLEPTVQSVIDSEYDVKRIILVIAYEERGGKRVHDQAEQLIAQYKEYFLDAFAVEHPDNIPGEIIGKGGNITYAGRRLQTYLEDKKIDPMRVVVTTLDADNHPDKKYFAALTYVYAMTPDPLHVSFQPIVMYSNNIWDAPAPMRVLATGSSLWNIVMTLRPHLLRNFSSHAQSMQALIDTDFWSVRTIVEDGHQFWRSYFTFDGNHVVYPIYIPVYQDAVLSSSYRKTLKAQFIQLRRWAYGASDVSYVAEMGFFRENKVPRLDLITKFMRLMEGHVNWAIGPPMLAFSAFVPGLFNPQNYAANLLPIIISRVQEVALAGALVSVFICLKTLPPKPARYKRHRTLFMVVQWVYLPVVGLVYSASAALYSQTRLMFGWYLDKFDVTDKAVVDASTTTDNHAKMPTDL